MRTSRNATLNFHIRKEDSNKGRVRGMYQSIPQCFKNG